MTFSVYIQRQKSLIRSRHEGEEFLSVCGNTVKLNSADDILKELDSLKGLNTAERMGAEPEYAQYAAV